MADRNYIPPSRRVDCSSCGRVMQKSSTAVPRCLACRKAEHNPGTRYRRGCRCDECVEWKRAQNKAEWVSGNRTRATVQRSCEVCSVAFDARRDEVRRGRGRFCSLRCGNVARNDARGFVRGGARGSVKSEFRKRAERLAKRSELGTTGKGRVWVQGDCAVCGESFMSPGAASRYCSRECREKNRQRVHGLSWLERMALFARDGWVCQICFEPVDYAAPSVSDRYPTVDHVVPRSLGGGDEESNLRTAHRWCNSARGDGSFYSDSDVRALALGV